jgi:hypothetical protein
LICASCCATNLAAMTRIELSPELRPDGTIVLRGAVLGPWERVRRAARRITRRTR